HNIGLALAVVLAAAACGGTTAPTTGQNSTTLGFFVTSATSVTGNLGGLAGADALCQSLATAVGFGSKTWRAYLSVERDGPNGDTSGTLSSWNSAHANQNCSNTAPRGGAGRIYCFAR